MTEQLKKRLPFIFFVLIFVIPFLLALIVLKTGFWQTLPQTQSGKLINQPLHFTDLILPSPPASSSQKNNLPVLSSTWKIIYIMPEQCDNECKAHLWQMKQIHIALGVDQPRVTRWAIKTLNTQKSDAETALDPELLITLGNTKNIVSLLLNEFPDDLAQGSQGKIFVVDPAGNIVLGYGTGPTQQKELLHQGKGMLSDLRKLLKLSRIG